jgi:phage gp29-like protein
MARRASNKTHLPVNVAFAAAQTLKPPEDKIKKSPALLVETAFDQMLGLLAATPDPDEVLKKVGITRDKLRMLEADDELTAALDTRREAIIGMPWRVEPVEGEESDQTKFIAAELKPIMEQAMRGVLNAVPYGYSVCEIIYAKRDSGQLGLHSIVEKPLEWFAPKSDGTLLWFSPTAPQGEAADPAKFLLSVRQFSYRNPYGESLLSRLYWPWFFRQKGWQFWARWLERFGQPFLLGKTKGDAAAMASALAQAVNGAALAIHQDDDIIPLDVTGTGEQFRSFDEAIVKRYHKLILGQTLTSDVGDTGSYAAAAVHNDVRGDKRNADVRLVTKAMQRVVRNLWLLNAFGDELTIPAFVLADDTGLEMERATRDATLVGAGILTLTEEYLLDRYDYRPGDFTVPEPMEATPEDKGAQPERNANKAEEEPVEGEMMASTTQRFTNGQQAIEDLADATLSGLPPVIEQAAVLRAIRLSTSPEDLLERLALLFQEVESAEFKAKFEEALFAAEVMGYAHADDPEAQSKAPQVINITAQMPEQTAPTVVVNVPEQAAPVVNVSNNLVSPEPVVNLTVEPAPVSVTNVVTVPPRTTETVIERDQDGNIVRAVQTDVGPETERTLN